MSKYANIGVLDSNIIPDFEREAYLHLIIKTFKDEVEAISKASSKKKK